MGDEFNFEKLNVYNEAIAFVTAVYKATADFPKNEQFGLVNQLRRAAVSVVSNICEGSSRGQVEFRRYLDISRGSIFECVGQLKIALELNYLTQEQHKPLYC